eukprot:m.15911 g.15911  ORF g.15911 m.15911 type:complete len:218 (+) comp5526_c0_seq1:111-764(+)
MSFGGMRGGGGDSQDRTTFVGVVVPSSIKKLPKNLTAVGKPIFKTLLNAAISHLKGENVELDIPSLSTEKLSEEQITTTFTGIYDLLKASFRIPEGGIKKQVYTEDLEALKIPNEFALDIVKSVFGSKRAAIDEKVTENRVRLPGLQNLKWRCDVAISTSTLKRAMKPSVLMQMTLTNGKIHTFELPLEQFHKLRYNVAFVLKEMEDLEKRNILQAP